MTIQLSYRGHFNCHADFRLYYEPDAYTKKDYGEYQFKQRYYNGNQKDRLFVIREKLGIKEIEKLHIKSRGINYTQMKAMLTLKSNQKYIDFTSTQLEILRCKMLFTLEEDVKAHIFAWERRMGELEQVAEYKGFKI